jgi:hypothetical protein
MRQLFTRSRTVRFAEQRPMTIMDVEERPRTSGTTHLIVVLKTAT